MIFILKVLCFLLGLCVAVQVVGALMSLIDFWSCLRRHWPLAVRAIVVWCGLALVLTAILGDSYRIPYLWGIGAYFVFYPLSFFGGQLLIVRNRRLINEDQLPVEAKFHADESRFNKN